jgi:hypothetical protein
MSKLPVSLLGHLIIQQDSLADIGIPDYVVVVIGIFLIFVGAFWLTRGKQFKGPVSTIHSVRFRLLPLSDAEFYDFRISRLFLASTILSCKRASPWTLPFQNLKSHLTRKQVRGARCLDS